MRQFRTIFTFEYLGYVKNKAFIGTTVALLAVMAVVLCFPRFSDGSFLADLGGEAKTLAVAGEGAESAAASLQAALPDMRVIAVTADEAALEKDVLAGECHAAVRLLDAGQYRYITETAGMTDMTPAVVQETLSSLYRAALLSQYGLTPQESAQALSAAAVGETVTLGKDQSQTFVYTYVLILLLYMVVLIYGQMVAQSVAVEKSSRAMELLITSAKPMNLMFGKVLGTGAAGFTQLAVVLAAAFLLYRANSGLWAADGVVASIFNMPLPILLYTVLFFVLGFFLYAFLYAAAGSLANRLEDINTLATPVTFLMIFAFVVSMFSMLSDVDSALMRAASFFPLTAPMAMFTRICMGSVAPWEIVVCVALLVLCTLLFGALCAAVYRVGVLLYGKPPKPLALLRAMKGDRAARRQKKG